MLAQPISASHIKSRKVKPNFVPSCLTEPQDGSELGPGKSTGHITEITGPVMGTLQAMVDLAFGLVGRDECGALDLAGSL